MPRPRTPTNVLEFRGAFDKNPQRRKQRENEPKLAKGIGEPPDWLDAYAQEEWHRIVPDLEAAGVTSRVEATALGAYCQAVSRLRKAEKDIADNGIIAKTPQGPKKSPAVSIAKESMLVIAKFATEFGMTPASRSKVQAKPAAEEKPAADSFAAV